MTHWMINQSGPPQPPAAEVMPNESGDKLLLASIIMAVLLVVVLAPVEFLLNSDPDLSWALNACGAIGTSVFLILCLAGVSYLVYRVTGRSTQAGGAVMVALCSLMLMGSFLRLGGEVLSRAGRRRDLNAAVNAAHQAVRQQTADNGSADPANIEPVIAALGRMGKEGTGLEAQMGRAGARFMREVAIELQRYNEAMQPLVEAGGHDPTTLPSLETVEARLAMANRAIAAHGELHAFLLRADERAEELAIEEGASAEAARGMARGVLRGMRLETLNEVHVLEAQLLANINKTLLLLRDHWGYWGIDEQTQSLWFTEEAAGDRFDSIIGEWDTLSSQQVRLREAALASTSP